MNLFNEYYSSELQFLFSLFALNRDFSLDDALVIAKRTHVFSPKDNLSVSVSELLGKYIEKGFFTLNNDSVTYSLKKLRRGQLNTGPDLDFVSFDLPMSKLEEEYLTSALGDDAFNAFLNYVPEPLKAAANSETYKFIERIVPYTKADSESTCFGVNVSTILQAVYEKRKISYSYRTNSEAELTQCVSVPYRLEYSAFDGRWWVILYDTDRGSTIKARLDNITGIVLSERHDIPEDTIHASIMNHLSSEYAVLKIRNGLNAFERCFILFENMIDISSRIINDDEAELRFRFFDWDTELIVKKLLFLGKNVTLIEPDHIVKRIIERLRNSIALYK